MHTHNVQMESDSFCSSFIEHFCRGEPAMGVEYETNLCRAVLAEITAADVASVVHTYDWTRDCVVKLTRPRAGWLRTQRA